MKKTFISFLLMGAVCLMADCTPEDANNVIDSVENLTGVNIDYEVTQEDVDKVSDTIEAGKKKVNEVKEKVTNVVTDEKVRQSVSDLFESVKNASESEETTPTPTPEEQVEEEEE